jgi:hypothetical protein
LYFHGKNPQALVSFKKYMPPPPLQTKSVNPIADFDVCNKKNPMNITIKGKIQQS